LKTHQKQNDDGSDVVYGDDNSHFVNRYTNNHPTEENGDVRSMVFLLKEMANENLPRCDVKQLVATLTNDGGASLAMEVVGVVAESGALGNSMGTHNR